MAQERIKKELKDLESLEDTCSFDPDDLFHWTGTLMGPDGSPYENGLFNIEIHFPNDYPSKPPTIKFVTKIYHVNIKRDTGEISLGILKDNWSPEHTISKVLLSIASLLSGPNPDDPLEEELAKLYKSNHEQYKKNARQWTEQYAQ
jgi:ubiquitin-conjugating enzyme E2 D/E